MFRVDLIATASQEHIDIWGGVKSVVGSISPVIVLQSLGMLLFCC